MKKLYLIIMLALTVLVLINVSSCKKEKDSKASGVFEDSFDNLTSYPAPEKQTIHRIDGKELSLLVYPGQVIVLSPGGTVSEINNMITQNGGTVTMQVPLAGLYLATLDAEKENDFIRAMSLVQSIADAFPNAVIRAKGESGSDPLRAGSFSDFKSSLEGLSINGDKNSLVQTIDLNVDVGCPDKISHMQAVANVAAEGGVSVNINDVTVSVDAGNEGADYCKAMKKTLEVLNYAHDHNLPVVINMSMGGIDTIPGDNYWYYRRYITMFQAIEMKTPHLLDNAVLLMSAGNINVNETDDLTYLDGEFPGSPLWDHVYIVGSEEGSSGCGMGYANNGTAHYLAAPACNVQVPNSSCPGTGNSLAVPQISSLVAQTFEMLQQAGFVVSIPEITSALWQYQVEHNGQLPTVNQLFNVFAGGTPDVDYSGTWSGTFYYKATIPQPSGPPQVVNTSFILTFTLESTVAVPGYSQMLTATAVTCSDPVFGAVTAVTPDAQLSIALLPATYGVSSDLGMGITIKFPNGSEIFTSNVVAGAFTVSEDGRTLQNSNLVTNTAFSAIGTVQSSNEPGSGPGGYAYNWCTFKSWSLTKL